MSGDTGVHDGYDAWVPQHRLRRDWVRRERAAVDMRRKRTMEALATQ